VPDLAVIARLSPSLTELLAWSKQGLQNTISLLPGKC
jgi:hypothetical protein